MEFTLYIFTQDFPRDAYRAIILQLPYSQLQTLVDTEMLN